MRSDLILRTDYFADPAAFRALVDLLADIFGIDIGQQNRFGGPDPSSMPFGYFDAAGCLVANFSAFAMPLMVAGRPVRAVGYQSGAVRPECRGRGLYRDLLERSFAWADSEGFEAGLLLTDKPALYERYGFRVVPQFCFRGAAPAHGNGGRQRRDLSLDNPSDVVLLRRMLGARQPVSARFAVQKQEEMFLLNACLDPTVQLSLLHNCNAVMAWRMMGDGALQVLDIVAPEIPPLRDLLHALGEPAETVEVRFSADRLSWTGAAVEVVGGCALMVKGMPAVPPKSGLMLSPMAEF